MVCRKTRRLSNNVVRSRCHYFAALLGFMLSLLLARCEAFRVPSSNVVELPEHSLECRGGALNTSTASEWPPRDEHEEWLKQQAAFENNYQAQEQQQTTDFTSISIVSRIQSYIMTLYELSPALVGTTISCLGVFLMWQIPRLTGQPNQILSTFFINSWHNTKVTWGLSLILSSLSHMGAYHILVNLFALSHFGPSVKRLVLMGQQRKKLFSTKSTAIWPLLVSSAIVSNLIFFIFSHRRSASSLGLSGVTAALAAVQARAYPRRIYRVMLMGVIPISSSAQDFLKGSILLSLLGYIWSLSASSSQGGNPIAHMAHLGGLVYGVLYYESFVLQKSPTQVVQSCSKAMSRWWKSSA